MSAGVDDRRDLFAAHALTGLIAAGRENDEAKERTCEIAADWAEAMLTVLNKRRRERDAALPPLARPMPPRGVKDV
jgi:hypothetical protein